MRPSASRRRFAIQLGALRHPQLAALPPRGPRAGFGAAAGLAAGLVGIVAVTDAQDARALGDDGCSSPARGYWTEVARVDDLEEGRPSASDGGIRRLRGQ